MIAYSRPDASYVICSVPYHGLNWVGSSSCWPTSLPVFFNWSIPVFSIIIFPTQFSFPCRHSKGGEHQKGKREHFILSLLLLPFSLPVLRLPRWLHVHSMTYFCFKVWLNGQQKRATCFATYCSNTC